MLSKRMICVLWILVGMLSSGCTSQDPYSDINKNLAVEGIRLGQVEKELPAYLTGGERENCVYGYELRSAEPEVTVGISGDRGTLRKIITAIPDHIIFGISPGQEVSSAEESLMSAGFEKETSGHKYIKNEVRVELLSMENKVVDRVSIELIEK